MNEILTKLKQLPCTSKTERDTFILMHLSMWNIWPYKTEDIDKDDIFLLFHGLSMRLTLSLGDDKTTQGSLSLGDLKTMPASGTSPL